MAPDERRRAPAAVATAAAAIVASTVVSPLAAHRYARTGSRPDANPGLIARTATIEQIAFATCATVCAFPSRMKSSNPPLSLGIPPIIVPQRGPHLGVQRERHRLQGRRAGGGPRDPLVDGVTIYLSDFKLPLGQGAERRFFSEPSQTALACVRSRAPPG